MVTKMIAVEDIINKFKSDIIEVKGNAVNRSINNVADPQHTIESTLDWVNQNQENKQKIVESSIARVIIVDRTVNYTSKIQSDGKLLIYVENPRMMMAKIMNEFLGEKVVGFVHPSAIIHEEAKISPHANIGAGCVVGKAKIGAGTELKPNVVIYDDVELGDNCLIQAGVVIGTDGLGCMRELDGKLVKFPHLGGVKIGDNVEIGANSQIARGVLNDTIISNGCKINGLCFISHNCVLDDNVWITGNTMLCGSSHVKKNATIFSNVVVREKVTIGAGVTVGMGSVVTNNIPAGETWFGSPAHKK
ncbi:MAG: DapH/DapD/GlmU-related protein [Clostridia bacterium]|nr:DapH/DapD/GlmU-related protein [Clostridia bacterium]